MAAVFFSFILTITTFFRIHHQAVASTTSLSFLVSSVQRGVRHQNNKILILSFTTMRRRPPPTSPSTSTQQQQQQLLSSSNNGHDNNNNEADDDSDTTSLLDFPAFNRGVYFGAWGQPVYEKNVPLKSSTKRSSSSHVWVRVHAVGLNPVDAKHVIGDKLKHDWVQLRRWAHRTMVQDTRVGFDFSGIIVVGNNTYEKGTRVFGTMPPLQVSCAEYVKVPLNQIAKAPNKLTLTESAALPLVGLTAWQALSPHIMQQQEEQLYNSPPLRVLVIGGSGGTGHVALQVAKALLGANNADLVTICSTRNIDFVKQCGATRVVDYSKMSSTDEMVQEVFRDGPFDLILDCVTSGDPEDAQHQYPAFVRMHQQKEQQQQQQLLQSNNRRDNYYLYQRLGGEWTDWIRAGIARILPKLMQKWLWKDPRERLFWIRFPHLSHELQELARLADQGVLKPKIQKVYKEFSAATVKQAFDDITSRRVQGKVVVQVLSDNGRDEAGDDKNN
jgi:NADPH:quinone reductase-like Zn-dependent oxidoreductase